MAKLRLFANLRELAGESRVEVAGATVGEIVGAAVERYGPEFEEGVQVSRIWVNGEEADATMPVGDQDEVVVLPPVSGGSQPATLAPADLLGALPVVVAVLVAIANLQAQPIWAAALVAVAAAWALDISSTYTPRGRLFAPLPVVMASAGAALLAHIMGGAGYGLSLLVAVAAALGWAVAFPVYRQVEVFSPTVLVALLGGMGTASLVLAHSSFTPDPRAVDVFLVSVIAGVVAGAVVMRLPPFPFIDSFSATAVVTVAAFVTAAAIWDLDVVGYLLVGLGVAVSMVAGTGLSSMLRSGRVALAERPPGALVTLDGISIAAALYYPLIRLLL